MLLAAPPVLWDVGFQLSALATAGLIWFGGSHRGAPARWPALVREPVALTLAAQLTTLPVILLNFERLSLVSPLANVVVVPLVPVVMLAAALAAPVGRVLEARCTCRSSATCWAGRRAGAPGSTCALMIVVGQVAAALPFASVDADGAPLAGAGLVPGAAARSAAGCNRARCLRGMPAATVLTPPPMLARAARPLPIALLSAAILLLLTVASLPDGRLRLVMLDVGQGDAILVRAPSGATAAGRRRTGSGPGHAPPRRGAAVLAARPRRGAAHPPARGPRGRAGFRRSNATGSASCSTRGAPIPTRRTRASWTMPPRSPTPGSSAREPGCGWRWMPRPRSPSSSRPMPICAAPLPDGDINNASVVSEVEWSGLRILLMGDAEAPVEAAAGAARPAAPGRRAQGRPPRVELVDQPSRSWPRSRHRSPSSRPGSTTITGTRTRSPSRSSPRSPAWCSTGPISRAACTSPGIGHPTRADPAAGSIGPWPYPIVIARRRSCAATSCPMGSCVHSEGVARVAAEAARLVLAAGVAAGRGPRRGRRPAARHRQAARPRQRRGTRDRGGPLAHRARLRGARGPGRLAPGRLPARRGPLPDRLALGDRRRWRIGMWRRSTWRPMHGSTRWPNAIRSTATS